MTYQQFEQSLYDQANKAVVAILQQVGVPVDPTSQLQAGEFTAASLGNPRISLACDLLIGDPNPNIPGT